GGLGVTDVRADSAAERNAGQGAQPGLANFGVDPAGGADVVVQAAKAALRTARASGDSDAGVGPAGGPAGAVTQSGKAAGAYAGPAIIVRVLDLPLEASLVSAALPAD